MTLSALKILISWTFLFANSSYIRWSLHFPGRQACFIGMLFYLFTLFGLLWRPEFINYHGDRHHHENPSHDRQVIERHWRRSLINGFHAWYTSLFSTERWLSITNVYFEGNYLEGSCQWVGNGTGRGSPAAWRPAASPVGWNSVHSRDSKKNHYPPLKLGR